MESSTTEKVVSRREDREQEGKKLSKKYKRSVRKENIKLLCGVLLLIPDFSVAL